MKLTSTKIFFTAYNMSGIKEVEEELDIDRAIKIIRREFGETSLVEKIKVGLKVIYNDDYKPFRIVYKNSKNLFK